MLIIGIKAYLDHNITFLVIFNLLFCLKIFVNRKPEVKWNVYFRFSRALI